MSATTTSESWDDPVGRIRELEAEIARLRADLSALVARWDEQRRHYPIRFNDNAAHAEMAVRVCGDELRAVLAGRPEPAPLPLHRTEAGYPRCATCDGGGCPDCTDPA